VPKGYVLITEDVHDPEGMKAYGRASAASLMEHGGKPVIATEDVDVLEGEWHGTCTVLVEFPSVEAARAWYASDGYAAVKPLREAAAVSNAVLLPAFEMPARLQ
jgi:uncharacterized protein (DUF1330 family)